MMFAPIKTRQDAMRWVVAKYPSVPWHKEKAAVVIAVAYRLRSLAIKEIQDA